MQERSKKLRLVLLAATFAAVASLAAAQTTATTASPTTTTNPTTTNRTTVTTPSRSFLGTRSGPTTLGTSSAGSGGISPIASSGATKGSATVTPALAAPPTPVSTGGAASARGGGGLDCPTLAGTAVFADCEGKP